MKLRIIGGLAACAAAGSILTGCGGSTTPSSYYLPVWAHFRMDMQNHAQAVASGAKGNIKWTFQTGAPIFGTAAIGFNGTIYITSLDGNLYALNPDGSLRFKVQAGAGIEESGPGIAPDGSIVFGADDHKVYDVDQNTGQIRWTFQTQGIIFSSPAFESDGTVVIGSYFVNPGVASSGPFDGNVYALNLSNGTKKWSYQTGSAVGSSAAIGPDDSVYIGSNDGKMYSLNGKTGALNWAFTTGGIIESSPDLANGNVYFGCKGDNKVYAVNASTGALVWSITTGDKVVSSPAVSADGNTIYIGSWDHNLYALNAANGAVKWSFATPQLGDPSPVVGSDGTIYYSSNTDATVTAPGHIYAINPDGTQKWALAIDPLIYSSVSIGRDGTIYEGTMTGKFYAID